MREYGAKNGIAGIMFPKLLYEKSGAPSSDCIRTDIKIHCKD